jgi:hypothetical protein
MIQYVVFHTKVALESLEARRRSGKLRSDNARRALHASRAASHDRHRFGSALRGGSIAFGGIAPSRVARGHFQISLASLAVMAMLTFVAASLEAQSGSTPSAAPDAATAPIAPTGPLSDTQLNRIVKYIEERNKQATLDEDITHSLGLTKNGEVLTLQYRAVKDEQGVHHGFMLLEMGAGFLVVGRNAKGSTTFRVDPSLNPVAPVFRDLNNHDAVVPLNESTRKMLYDELLWWADIANPLIDKK